MAGAPTSRTFRRTALALVLCLLAFAFAMEAKLACYSPDGGPGSDIAAAKARPADLPEVVAHGVPAPDPVDARTLFFVLVALTTASLWKAEALRGRNIALPCQSVSSAAFFSSNLFFRPPHVR